jgi:hypothetical protein
MAAGRRHPQGPGQALAAKLGREAHFLLLPRKRIAMALESGQADLLCLYLPPALPGKFNWTRGFFPVSEVVVTDTACRSRAGCAICAASRWLRCSAITIPNSMPRWARILCAMMALRHRPIYVKWRPAVCTMLLLSRVRLIIISVGDKLSVYSPLVVKNYKVQCAVSPQAQVAVGAVNQAIDQLIKEGSMNKIISHYQNSLK